MTAIQIYAGGLSVQLTPEDDVYDEKGRPVAFADLPHILRNGLRERLWWKDVAEGEEDEPCVVHLFVRAVGGFMLVGTGDAGR